MLYGQTHLILRNKIISNHKFKRQTLLGQNKTNEGCNGVVCAKANVSVHVCESDDSAPALWSTDSVLLTEQSYRLQDQAAPETRWQ